LQADETIATREAVVCDATLDETVLAGFRAEPHRFSRRREMTAIRAQIAVRRGARRNLTSPVATI